MKLSFPSLLTPTTNLTLFFIFFLFYLIKSHLFSTSSPTFLLLHFLFFDLFLCHSCLALVSLFSNGSSKLSMVVVMAASIWVLVWVDGFFVESLILGSKLLSFPLKVWFWVWIDFSLFLVDFVIGISWVVMGFPVGLDCFWVRFPGEFWLILSWIF